MAFFYALEFSTQAYFPMKYSNQISVSNENQDEVLMKFMKFLLICESAMFFIYDLVHVFIMVIVTDILKFGQM